MIEKLQVLGKEIVLPSPLGEEEVSNTANLLKLIREIDESIASQLQGTSFTVEINEKVGIVVRSGAVMG